MAQRRWLFALLGVMCTNGALAATAPTAVSPGSATGSLIGETCPTFSWGAMAGAKGYELVVYRLGGQGKEAQPVHSGTTNTMSGRFAAASDLA